MIHLLELFHCLINIIEIQSKSPKWPDAKMDVFFKSPNLFFIFYFKFDRVFTCKAAKMAKKSINVNAFEDIFGHLNNN